jgi:excisionase family DNA binding protein
MFLTVKQVALRLNVSLSTVYEEIRAGRLTVFRLGVKRGVIRISEDALAAYLQSRKIEEAPPTRVVGESARVLKHISLDDGLIPSIPSTKR